MNCCIQEPRNAALNRSASLSPVPTLVTGYDGGSTSPRDESSCRERGGARGREGKGQRQPTTDELHRDREETKVCILPCMMGNIRFPQHPIASEWNLESLRRSLGGTAGRQWDGRSPPRTRCNELVTRRDLYTAKY